MHPGQANDSLTCRRRPIKVEGGGRPRGRIAGHGTDADDADGGHCGVDTGQSQREEGDGEGSRDPEDQEEGGEEGVGGEYLLGIGGGGLFLAMMR